MGLERKPRGYPAELETYAVIKDGTRVFFRPIKPSDESLMRELSYSFSEETIYHRFFGVLRDMPPERLKYFVNVDYESSMAIVAVVEEKGRERLIAVGRYAKTVDSDMAEVACVVQDNWQNKGVGKFLLTYLIEIAKKHGIAGFTAEVMSDNTRMLQVFEKSGYSIKSTMSGNVYQVSFRFNDFKTPT